MFKVFAIALALALLALLTPSAASPTLAAHAVVFRGAGRDAVARFESWDASGCIETDVVVGLGIGTVQVTPGGPVSSQGAGLTITQFDHCQQMYLLDAFGSNLGEIVPIDVQIARDLSSATVSGPVGMADFLTANKFDVNLNLTWTAVGASQRSAGSVQSISPGGTVVVHSFDGVIQPAQASGTVTDGSTNYLTNSSVSADIESVSNMGLTVSIQ